MEDLVITKFESVFLVNDQRGRRKEFFHRPYACFIVTVKGRIRFSFAGGFVESEPSHPVFLPRGISYLNECLEDAESYVFNLQVLGEGRKAAVLSPIPEHLVRSIYERILSLSRSPSPQSNLLIFESLYTLAARLSSDAAPADGKSAWVRTAIRYMMGELSRADLTIGEIARHCCISEVYLRKLFAAELQISPFAKLFELRMEQARRMLDEKRPLKEIAAGVGYADVFQFSRAYKRRFGISPLRSVARDTDGSQAFE